VDVPPSPSGQPGEIQTGAANAGGNVAWVIGVNIGLSLSPCPIVGPDVLGINELGSWTVDIPTGAPYWLTPDGVRTGPKVTQSWSIAGTYSITLVVAPLGGQVRGSCTTVVTVEPPQTPSTSSGSTSVVTPQSESTPEPPHQPDDQPASEDVSG
jgi:hypothetical protein